MRRLIALLAFVALAAGCHQRATVLTDSSPAHVDPNSTSILGDWVLSTDPDSTAFIGARLVELKLEPASFILRVHYGAGGSPLVASGTAALAPNTGLLTLTPQSVVQGASMGRQAGLAPGQPITVMTSAAGGTMLFAPAGGSLGLPSSVWHRMEAARAAGILSAGTTQAAARDSL